jgi:hypothetical protein
MYGELKIWFEIHFYPGPFDAVTKLFLYYGIKNLAESTPITNHPPLLCVHKIIKGKLDPP